MSELILTEEQARIVEQAGGGRIGVRNAKGQLLGYLEAGPTPEQAAELKQRAAQGPWFTGQQVQARLQALQAEWDRTGGFDQAYMRAFLDRLDEADPPRTERSGGRPG
jgi:hypothetical protein